MKNNTLKQQRRAQKKRKKRAITIKASGAGRMATAARGEANKTVVRPRGSGVYVVRGNMDPVGILSA